MGLWNPPQVWSKLILECIPSNLKWVLFIWDTSSELFTQTERHPSCVCCIHGWKLHGNWRTTSHPSNSRVELSTDLTFVECNFIRKTQELNTDSTVWQTHLSILEIKSSLYLTLYTTIHFNNLLPGYFTTQHHVQYELQVSQPLSPSARLMLRHVQVFSLFPAIQFQGLFLEDGGWRGKVLHKQWLQFLRNK